MSNQIRTTSESLDDIIKNDSDNLTKDQKKVLQEASDILFWESIERLNAFHEERIMANDELRNSPEYLSEKFIANLKNKYGV